VLVFITAGHGITTGTHDLAFLAQQADVIDAVQRMVTCQVQLGPLVPQQDHE
jgi:hypothetical protein